MRITVTHVPDEVLSFAGDELRSYLGRMLPKEGPDIALSLSVRPAGPQENDAFSLQIGPSGGALTGNSPRAVLLGAYDLLHTLGCRFTAPDKNSETVPSIPRSALAARYEKTASYRHRGVCLEGADSQENILAFIDWLPKLGYNCFFLQFKTPYIFLERWYAHESNPLLPPEDCSGSIRAIMAQAQAAIKRRGLMLHKVGHGWTGEVLGYTAQSWLPDDRPLAEELRPLAAEVGGIRGLYKGVPANTNLCLSEPRAVERMTDLVVRYALEDPEADYLHVWLADDYNNVCECAACRKTTPSDQYAALLNGIDARLTAKGLDTKLVFLIYQELLWPPVRERLKNPDRFVLMFAPISRTFERSYDPAHAGTIPAYVRNRITLPDQLEDNIAFLRGWQALFSGESFLYDYPLGRAHYGDLGYVHMARIIHDDIAQLDALGLDGYISCQELRAGMPNFLPNYVMGMTLFDRNADADALIREYFQSAYGTDADRAYEFLSALSALELCDYVNGKGPRTDPVVAARAERSEELCRQFLAREMPGDSSFWRRLYYHAEYAALFSRALALLARGRTEEARRTWGAMADFIRAGETAYQPWLDVYRVLNVTAAYTGF